ncbi:MAG: Rrf2 family transcriptional regulator [Lachnospiraceae bacterium]|nr:Rrf2 family transcriptional regulator [Lachnospiraceae bacterium]
MRVSKRFPLAVHALLFVAVLSPGKRVTSTLVAESTGTNAVTVRNLFLELSDSGLLIATAGKNGGVQLAREPKTITLWDIYQAVETPNVDEIFKMYEGSDPCPVGKNFYQILHPHMASAVDAMKSSLEQVTLETLKEELQPLLKDLRAGKCDADLQEVRKQE